jgi:competence protein ComEA
LKKLFCVVLAWLAAISVAFAAIDINKASEAELDKLPGIGPAKAKAIVEDRQKNGPFKNAEDLQRVKGIGAKTFDKLKGEITVGGAGAAKPVPAAAAAKPAAQSAPATAKPAAQAAPAAAAAKPADVQKDQTGNKKAKDKDAKQKDEKKKDDKKKADKHPKDAKADDGGKK